MNNIPALFISKSSHLYSLHGDSPAANIIDQWAPRPMPKAVLIISPIITSSSGLDVGISKENSTLFVQEFSSIFCQLDHPVVDSHLFSKEVISSFTTCGLPITLNENSELDYVAMNVLVRMFQGAKIPVVQISLGIHANPIYYYLLGQALADIKKRGVLIVGSGSLTCHHPITPESIQVPDWVIEFEEWMGQQISDQNIYKLIEYRKEAPFANFNHPSNEQLMPLFVLMGAAGVNAKNKQVYLRSGSRELPLDGFVFS